MWIKAPYIEALFFALDREDLSDFVMHLAVLRELVRLGSITPGMPDASLPRYEALRLELQRAFPEASAADWMEANLLLNRASGIAWVEDLKDPGTLERFLPGLSTAAYARMRAQAASAMLR